MKKAKDKWGKTRDRTGSQQAAETWKLYYENNKGKLQEYDRRQDPKKRSARNKLNAAIRNNQITRQPCEVCGKEKVDAHHDDYDKPLEVRWLCRTHHSRLHKRGQP